MGYLVAMLRALVADADRPALRASVIGPAERALLVDTWNRTEAPYPGERCIHQLFEEQVRRTPEAIAVVQDDLELTYAELDRRANRIAHALIRRGVGPDARVALCLERHPRMVVSLLAVLKAGGAYLPLEPGDPRRRLEELVRDADPLLVVVDAAGREALGPDVCREVPILQLEELDGASGPVLVSSPEVVGLTSAHLAYVIYTSGSTGTPKGVANEHRAIVNRLTWMQRACGIDGADVVLQKTPYTFDVSVWELFWTLLQGATLVLAAPQGHKDSRYLVELIRAKRITTVHFVPSMLQSFLDADGAGECVSLERVICSGEALAADSARRCRQTLPGASLHNLYGPTEAAIDVTAWSCPASFDGSTVPIGRPIDNTAIHILNRHGEPAPAGARGDLHIGGAGVARGYPGRPALTAERFVPDPFGRQPGARLYRTGDQARYLSDGNIEFLGRDDDQVKVRGHRIELGEIEARLREHPAVREAVVVASHDSAGDTRLVAYVTTLAGGETPPADLVVALRRHLSEALPDTMVPSAFVRLEALPLTPNGKLDRKSLPAPDGDAVARRGHEQPEGHVEETLAAIWAELLGLERVGRHDHFFELGGHSLVAVRLQSRLLDALGVELPLAGLFAQPVLARQADAVAAILARGGQAPASIARVARGAPLALSFAQQRLWFLAQLGTGTTYHMPMGMRLVGALDRDAWRRSLDRLLARHEALRSVFISVGGEPRIKLLPETCGFALVEEDLEHHPRAAERLEELSELEAHAPFDLEHGPLIRGRLLRLGPEEHVFLLTQHHIVSDEWSMAVLTRELDALYRAFAAGRADPLPTLDIQYPDYAAWQREWLAGDRLAAQVDYWRDALAGAPALLELPTDRQRPDQQSYTADFLGVHIDPELTRGLERVSRQHGTTPFMTVLAAWVAVLARLSGQHDLVIGTPTANRGRREVEGLIGFFVNTLALRFDLSGEPTLAELLDQVRTTALAAQDRQDLPFEQVVEIAEPARRLDQTPIFQVLFAWQNHESGGLDLPGLTIEPAGGPPDAVKFDIELSLGVADGSIVGGFLYSSALFDAATIERHRGYLVAALRALVADADQPALRVDLLDAAERTLTLETWNQTEATASGGRLIHQLFEQQARRAPDAVALLHDDLELSYAELNRRANRIAHRLLRLGVGPDARVALCAERSVDLVIAVVAILKAGGAYVPLDPGHPRHRLDELVRDAAPVLVLCDAAGRAALAPDGHIPLLAIEEAQVAGQLESDPVVAGLTAAHLAYIIYTSGSTGVPKGVLVEHAQVVRLFDATRADYRFDEHDVWCLFHSLAFDFSVWELWGALAHGGRLVIVPRDVARSAPAFHRLVCERGVTVLNQTPSAFGPFIEAHAASGAPNRLRTVIFGGEALEPRILERWYASEPDQAPQLVNMYGITETTVHVTYRPLTRADTARPGSPIGRRIRDLRIYLLDRHGEPVPRGVVGELHVGGAGLARGYLDRPQLSAERFVPDPFGSRPGARLYRTGDLARFDSDGNLDFRGRNDHQIKIRGHRIELGEIEARLAQHPAVREAVVIADGEAGDRRLVAYVTSAAGTDLLAGELVAALRHHLVDRLPEYMVPAAFVRLDALPLTPNGKLDRAALPAPDGESVFARIYEAPEGPIEETLAALWAELLDLPRVGRHDNFFELGGHSLLAVTLMARLRSVGLGTEVRTLFVTPTLSALAAQLGGQRELTVPANAIATDSQTITPDQLPLIDLTQADIDRIVARTPGGVANIQDIYALSPLQEGILFHHMLDGAGDPYLLVIRTVFPGRSLLDRYLGAVQEVVDRHDILRTAFVWQEQSAPAQVVWRRAPLDVTEVELEEEGAAASEELARRFDPRRHRVDLTRAPLLRFVVAREPGSERWLLLELQHHLIGDHSTMEILHGEVEALLDGRGHQLAAPQPFRNLVSRARTGVSRDEHERFFRQLLGDIDRPTAPFGLAEVHGDGSGVRESHRMLPDLLNDRLRAHARRLGVSLASLCHLAFGQVVARTSGRDKVVFGTVLLGRMHDGAGADRAMGLFINTLPVRLDLDDTTVEDSVRRTHTLLAELLRHEHVSLALAQRCSGVPAPAPLFSALLNYRHQSSPAARAEEAGAPRLLAEVEWIGAEERTNYPLTVAVEDFGQHLGLTAQAVLPLSPERVCDYMERALEELAEALERAPNSPVRRIDVLPPTERTLLLASRNRIGAPVPGERCIHELFEAEVRRAPDAIAVVDDDVRLSYAELNRRANRLAHRLIALGVGPDIRVALCTERSIELVVGLLAILKAGGAYLPLDPGHPRGRLEELVCDARPALVLCDEAGRQALGPGASGTCELISIRALDETSPERDLGDRDIELDSDPVVPCLTSTHLAYVIYTSGSTGMPKGVMVEHGGLVASTHARLRQYGGYERLLLLTSIAFDSSAAALFGTLGGGGTLHLRRRLDPHDLRAEIERGRVTTLLSVPSLLQALVGEAAAGRFDSLREVISGGESCPPTLIADLRRVAPEAALHNEYGPTETTVWAASHVVDPARAPSVVPIGRAIESARIVLLGGDGEPVPLGATGELVIGGAGVARGYLDRPELTAERFVPDPFSGEPGARMYRTGDLSRYLPDGDLEFLGRTDLQIKVRGHRVELGEIEARLREHPAVREVVVIAREDAAGDARLIAHVTRAAASEDVAPADLVAALRRHLADRLPEYMVPSAFVRLDALPTTPNGKVDREALPAPDGEAVPGSAYQAPEGTIEETLAALWVELLGLARVGRRDNFFEIGGHSLLAVRLQSRVSGALGVELPLTTLFARPTVAALAEEVGRRLADSGAQALPPIGRASREGPLVLSFAQQRLWFLAQLGAGDTYHMPMGLRLSGALDADALRRSLDRLVARHEALRSVFVSVEGQAQVALLPESCGFALVEHDLTSEPDAAEQFEQLCIQEARAPFDLERGPLIRGRLLRLGPDEHVLLLTLHHIVSDGWSMGVLTGELGALYRAFAAGHEDPLPPLEIQYPDYAAWQREWLSGDRLEAQADHWRRTLVGAPALLELPTDRPRPEEQSFAAAGAVVHVNAELTCELERVGQEHGTTLFMTLLAAWAAVLGRLSGQDDVVIGTPTANRGRREVEGLIGCFVNSLALRIDLSGEPSLAELLARVRAAALAAQDHQDLPFEQVVEIVAPPRRMDHSPVFQVMFAWQNEGDESGSELPGLRVSPAGASPDTVKFDLELGLGERDGAIVGGLMYASALFDAATIERHRGYFLATLRALVADVEQPVSRVDLVAPAERALLVETWNQTEAPYPRDRCIQQLFADQARRTPEAIALVNGEVELSYAELDRQANILAHRLIEEGVRPGDRVAIVADRSRALVVAELAILKAGAAYVPLDPRAPAARKAWMVADCAARLVLTGADAAVGAEADVAIDVATLAIDEVVADPAPDPGDPASPVSSHDPAYVMYTSGSTGTPKGVVVPHRAVNRLVFDNGYADFSAGDRIAFVSNPAFDASTMDVWAPLLTGGRMIVIDRATVLDPARFAQTLEEQAVTVLSLTTGLFNRIAPRLEDAFRRLRILIIGGDVVDPRVLARVWSHGRPQHLVNTYGPTETTLFATSYELTDEPDPARSVPIGRPIANTRIYLLDRHGQPVPRGAIGEIVIGGDGVAIGYLDRPELTDERFVRDPFRAEPDARMYRTGDLARHLPDGNLEFLGRTDNQVKVRGYRIEPGEIEARLCEHPAVREAVVIARADTDGDRRLVAYLTGAAELPPGELVPALRRHLAARLPEYMVPAAFVRLDALPLTPNGKLDRAALPAPDDDAVATATFEAPAGPIEEILAALWAELLGLERVGRHDDFFELGAHSLMAVTLMERLRRLGLGTDIRTLYSTPTLSALAATLGSHREVTPPASSITPDSQTITPADLPLIDLTQADIDRIVTQVPGGAPSIQDIYALAPLQEGILFHHRLASDGDPYLQVRRVAFPHRDLLDRYLAAVQQVVDRHDILRTAFVWEGLSTPAQVVRRNASLSVTEIELEAADAGAASEEMARRFDPRHYRMDLTSAPLLRYVVAREPGSERWLALELQHHLIGDHSTVEVLEHEVAALLDGRGHELAAPQPFRNLVAQARLGVSTDEHEDFFRELLGDIDEPTAPFGLRDVHLDGSATGVATRGLPASLNERLRAQARRLGVSLASVCHLAFGQVVAQTSGREQVVFGTVLFGRMQAGPGADRAVGLFINTLPVRLDLDDTAVEDGVRRAHTVLAGLLRHEHASLVLAQRCSGVAAPAPLFSALLNYRHNTPPTVADEEGPARPLSQVEWLGGEDRTNYPVVLSVEDFGRGLGLTAQVALPLSPERVCDLMERALEELAEALERDPRRPVRAIDVLPAAERALLVGTWNRTEAPYPRDRCIHQLFEEQLRRAPDATAVVHDGARLSYAELNQQANRLAHRLIALGVGPDVRVALCTERHPRMVVGLLGILKAGGAYVPLDPGDPRRRLDELVRDAGPALVVCDAVGREALGYACDALPVVDLDRLADDNADKAELDLNPEVPGLTSSHLAYVIYTSGSTGVPKGVAVTHRNVARLVLSTDYVQLGSDDVVAHAANPAFDASTFEVWGPLLHGGRLVVVPRDLALTPPAFASLLRAEGVTTLFTTTALFHQYAREAPDAFATLRTLLFGGEAIDPRRVRAVLDAGPPERLLHVYGPTETTTFATWHLVEAVPADAVTVPIGRPIANTTTYVLDAAMQPVPIGVSGELYIGGDGVARGYLDRPALTAERFVRDPFSHDPGARLYRTGDLVRHLPDGSLEFLGRTDHQIKVRGFRIELGEIEARLAEHPAVDEAVAIAREDAGDRRLVAYVTCAAGADLPASELVSTLRRHLADQLPTYMVPSAFVRLESLPLTPSGKLDRKALPASDGEAVLTRSYEAPEGEVEETLARLWAELLGLERVGRRDHFFELGGHSLLAAALVERLRRLGLAIELRLLYQSPTLEDLARRLRDRNDAWRGRAVPARTSGTRPPVFFVPTGMGDYSYVFELARDLDLALPVHAVPWEIAAGPGALTLEELAARTVALIQAVQPRGPYRLAGYSSGGLLAYASAQHLLGLGEAVSFIGLIDVGLPPPEARPSPTPNKILREYMKRKLAEDAAARERLEALPDDATLRELVREAMRSDVLGDAHDEQGWVDVWERSDKFDRAVLLYRPPVLPLAIHLFQAIEKDDDVVDAGAQSQSDDTGGWQRVLPTTSIHRIASPGDHESMVRDEAHRRTLGALLSRALKETES